MRAEVKLGMVISAVVVLVAGGYYIYRDRQETPIPIGDRSASAARPADKTKPGTPAASRPAPRGTQRAATRGQPANARGERGRRLTPGKGSGQGRNQVADAGDKRTSHPATGPAPSQPQALPRNVRGTGRAAADRPKAETEGQVPEGARQTSGTPVTHREDARGMRPAEGGGASNRVADRSSDRQPATGPVRDRARRDSGRASQQTRAASGGSPLPARGSGVALSGRPATSSDDATDEAVETHHVQPGDTFSSLAQMYYGDEKHAQFLMDQNPDVGDPTRLAVGAVVKIPSLSTQSTAPSTDRRVIPVAAPSESAPARRTYTVQAGDTLYGIARDALGDASRWKELMRLNDEAIKGDPTRLRIGQVIVLPES